MVRLQLKPVTADFDEIPKPPPNVNVPKRKKLVARLGYTDDGKRRLQLLLRKLKPRRLQQLLRPKLAPRGPAVKQLLPVQVQPLL